MKLVPYNVEKLRAGFKRTKNQTILEEFANSDYDCVEIKDFSHKNAKSCSSCLSLSVKRFGYQNIRVVQRGNQVFLIKVK